MSALGREKHLIVNADDFGFTRGVNEAIVTAHKVGILTATTLMANGKAFDHAVFHARDNPTLDVGVHIVLVQGNSVLTGQPLPQTLSALLCKIAASRLDAYAEGRAQIGKMMAAGLQPSHLDTHKHTHLLPQVFSAAVRLAQEFSIPFIRLPVWGLLAQPYRRHAEQRGIRFTDHLLGFAWTGTLDEHILLDAIPTLRYGITELLCHPGYVDDDLCQAPTRLRTSRLRELEALTSPRVRRATDEAGVRLANFRVAKTYLPESPVR